MMIVLVVPDTRGSSGWSRYALDLGKEYLRRGHRVIALVAAPNPKPWCEESVVLGPAVGYLRNPIACHWTALRATRVLRRHAPDIVHIIAEPYALAIPALPGVARCMTIHSTYGIEPLALGGWTRCRMESAYQRLDCLIAVSEFSKRALRTFDPELFTRLGLQRRITVVHNAIDLQRISTVERREDSGGPKRILGVGAVKRRKGYLQAVRACAALRDRWKTPFTYTIVGSLAEDRPYVDELRRTIEVLGLREQVILRGSVSEEDLARLYAEADLFLLLSLQQGYHAEGFGLVFLEASAHGVPVVGPTTGGCPEAIAEGRSGFTCDPEDSGLVAERMHAILTERAIDRRECRRWAEEHDIAAAAGCLLKLYGGARPPGPR